MYNAGMLRIINQLQADYCKKQYNFITLGRSYVQCGNATDN